MPILEIKRNKRHLKIVKNYLSWNEHTIRWCTQIMLVLESVCDLWFLTCCQKSEVWHENYLSCLPRTVKRTNYQTVWNDSERWQTCCNALKFIKINRRYHPLQICLTSVFCRMSLIHSIHQLYKIAKFFNFFLKDIKVYKIFVETWLLIQSITARVTPI